MFRRMALTNNDLPVVIPDINGFKVNNAPVAMRQGLRHFPKRTKSLLVGSHELIGKSGSFIKLQGCTGNHI